jgi:hypothetical protein
LFVVKASLLVLVPVFFTLALLVFGELAPPPPPPPLPVDVDSWLDRERGGRGREVIGEEENCSILQKCELPACLPATSPSTQLTG